MHASLIWAVIAQEMLARFDKDPQVIEKDLLDFLDHLRYQLPG